MELFDKDGKFVIDLPSKDCIPVFEVIATDGCGMPFNGNVNFKHVRWSSPSSLFFQLEIIPCRIS